MKRLYGILILSAALTGCATTKVPGRALEEPAAAFSLEQVSALARENAARDFEEGPKAPSFLTSLSYDQWRDIRFRPDKAVWKEEGLPFQLQFFHTGLYYDRPVRLNIVEGRAVRPVVYSPELFHYGANSFPEAVPPELGLAGFRIHHRLNTPDYFDEVAVFLGASYFRAVAKGQHYGISARGLAVNTAHSSGEEFPFFKEFWIVQPRAADRSLTVYALMDSPSLTGAYRFVITPGEKTIMDVEARLFIRRDIDKLGLAPSTSMFFFGENVFAASVGIRDFRPEVHDSDGLMLRLNGGEHLWRPLVNLDRLFMNSFQADDLEGLGLLQRDTDFDHYQDLESHYEQRPSLWITPLPVIGDGGLWQKGRVELVQIPTKKETIDNIVSYWVPGRRATKGDELAFCYRMEWLDGSKPLSPLASVTATRVGHVPDKKDLQFVLDIDGAALRGADLQEPLEAVVTSSRDDHRVFDIRSYKNEVTGGWRLAFQLAPEKRPGFELPGSDDPVVELRASLRNAERTLTETWSYAAQP